MLIRHFYRCPDCLTVSAAEHEGYGPLYRLTCELCLAHVEHMGHVDRLTPEQVKRRAYVCPCDGRCTGATGPKCECKCGGENHGTNALVAIDTIVGAAPRLLVKDKATAQRIADEWKAAKQSAIDRIAQFGTGWLDTEAYNRKWALTSTLHKARKLRSHAGRMKALGATIQLAPAELFAAIA